jgi:DNA-binding transcriptional ArsR family regulator
MSEARYGEVAGLLRVLGHPARLRILDEVRREPSCVCHLQAVLKRPQAYVSQQLRILREAGLVADGKDGLNVYYRLAHPQAARLVETLLGPAGAPSRPLGCPCPHCLGGGCSAPC